MKTNLESKLLKLKASTLDKDDTLHLYEEVYSRIKEYVTMINS